MHGRVEDYALDLGTRSGTTLWASLAFGGVSRCYGKCTQSVEIGVGEIEAQRRYIA